MSVNFGSDNETRWYILPGFTLPVGDWTWLAVTAPFNDNDWYIVFTRNTSGVTTSGNVRINTTTVDPQPPVVQGPLAGATALWKGYLSWAALLDVTLTDQDLVNLAVGADVLIPEHSLHVVDLWDFHEPLPSIPGQVTGDLALRYGEDYPAKGPDPLPYDAVEIWLESPIPDIFTSEWKPLTYNVYEHFYGTQRPFTYSVVSGVLPPGVSLSTDGILSVAASSSPATVSSVIVRATDSDGNHADTNSFSIRILPLPIFGEFELQRKRAGIPQNMTLNLSHFTEGWLPVAFLTRDRGVSNSRELFVEYDGDLEIYPQNSGTQLTQTGAGATRRVTVPNDSDKLRVKVLTHGGTAMIRTNGS